MLVLFLGLSVTCMIISIIISSKTTPGGYFEFIVHCLAWFFGALAILMIPIIYCVISDVATADILDDKIAMYQEENATIEQDIDRIVKEYLKHEHDTFTNLKAEESSITLVTLFPELKSDTLIQQQLEIYVANNARIRSLREEKIDIAKKKWMLYFGK